MYKKINAMQKFNIIKEIPVDGKNLYLLHQSFNELQKQEDFRFAWNRISSYHIYEQFKAEWYRYPQLMRGDIVIVSLENPEDTFNQNDALNFMGMCNGLAPTRDNLFMMWELFPDHLKGFREIIAVMNPEYLPDHLDEYKVEVPFARKICPVLEIKEDDGSPGRFKLNYDWSWFETDFHGKPYRNIRSFAFFRPSLTK